MSHSKREFVNIIKERREELIDNVCNRLQKLLHSHYELIDYERHQEREQEFLDIILKSLLKTI